MPRVQRQWDPWKGVRVGEASLPGPWTSGLTGGRVTTEQLTLWTGNIAGIPAARRVRWELARADWEEQRAQLVILTETHVRAPAAVNALRGSSFRQAVASDGLLRTAGVATGGPAAMRQDPWPWPAGLQGRVCSVLLPWKHTDMLIIALYGHSGSSRECKEGRRLLFDAVALRVAHSGLPSIITGDFNAEASESDCDPLREVALPLHTLLERDFATRGRRTLDQFWASNAITPLSLEPGALVSDHIAVILRVVAPAAEPYLTVQRAQRLTAEPQAWQDNWSQRWAADAPRWREALSRKALDAAWPLLSLAMETSAGCEGRLACRHQGLTPVCFQPSWRATPNTACRQPILFRRLHRTWRRLIHFIALAAKERVDFLLRDRLRTDLRSWRRRGYQIGTMEDPAGAERLCAALLEDMAATASSARLQAWRDHVRRGPDRVMHRAIRAQTTPVALAAIDPDTGQPTARPNVVLAQAEALWLTKVVEPLPAAQREQYCEAVRKVALPRPLPEQIERPLTIQEIKAAIRAAKGTAPGPGGWAAEEWLAAPEDALHALTEMCNSIVEGTRMPSVWTEQEVVLIPKDSGGIRPIGITPVMSRCLARALLARYKEWTRRVIPTDALSLLLEIDSEVSVASRSRTGLAIRQSDLQNCSGQLDARTAECLAMLYGMLPCHAQALFAISRRRPARPRTGTYLGGERMLDRGLPQGDPASPLAAALYAAGHRDLLAAVCPRASLSTYVDDRTLRGSSAEVVLEASALSRHWDFITDQAEEPAKTEHALVNCSSSSCCLLPGARVDFLDLLGIRLLLPQARRPGAPPRALRRTEEILRRLRRLRTLGVGPQRRRGGLAAVLGIGLWDGPWQAMDPIMERKIRTQTELVLRDRRVHEVWRHAGASALITPGSHLFDPLFICWSASIGALLRCERLGASKSFETGWGDSTLAPCLPILLVTFGPLTFDFNGDVRIHLAR